MIIDIHALVEYSKTYLEYSLCVGVFQQRIQLNPERIAKVVKATTVLQNSPSVPISDNPPLHGGTDAIPRDLVNANMGGNRATADAFKTRDRFNSLVGTVPWQEHVFSA